MTITEIAQVIERECVAAEARHDSIVYFRLVRDAEDVVVAVAVREQAHPPTGAGWGSWQSFTFTAAGDA